MLKRFKSHTGPSALIVAVIALLVALGGAAFAAHKLSGTTIKKGSEPGNRIKTDSLTGKQINESTLSLPASAVPKTTFGVTVNSDGSVRTSTLSGTTVSPQGGGAYNVTFPRSVQGCVPVASDDSVPVVAVRTNVPGGGAGPNVVFITLADGANSAFNLIVTC